MLILGISAYPLDSAACLMRDGQVLAAFEEERLTRVKHDGRFPYSAIEASLATAGVSLEDVTDVAFFMDPWLLLRKRIPYRLKTGLRFPTYGGGYLLYDVYTTMKFVYEVKQLAQKRGPNFISFGTTKRMPPAAFSARRLSMPLFSPWIIWVNGRAPGWELGLAVRSRS